MDDFERFRRELGNALNHLHDPDYQPPQVLCAILGCDPVEGPGPLQVKIIQVVEELKLSPGVPPSSRSMRDLDVLHHRFVVGLTHEEAAESLYMSVRTVQRTQREAIHTLAIALWEGRHAGEASEDERVQRETVPADIEASDWHSQAELELSSLQKSAPNRTADVSETLRDTLELENVLTPGPDLGLQLGYMQPNLVATVHPSALRQMLVAAIRRLAQHMTRGQITIYAGLEDASVKITLTGTVDTQHDLATVDLTHDILTPTGSSVEAAVDGSDCFLYIRVPSVGEITVLAVDDNPDMFHFYRRCTAGTRYRVIHAATGRQGQDIIERSPPDIVVLDVMLPDVDGWKMLMELREDLSTRSIPIIVCSVVREEDLAYSLGAALYLSKPIRPRQFAEALDRVYPQVSERDQRGRANNGATC